MLTREQIATRASRELQEGNTVVLGDGLARLIATCVPAGVELVEPGEGVTADVAVLTVSEVAKSGEFVGSPPAGQAKKVIALLEHHRGEDGTSRVRADCAAPAGKASLVITDLAVFDVTQEGLVLREVAPGVSALDVQLASEPPLLASDDLKVIAP